MNDVKEYFLSYSRADEAVALRFGNDLIAAGVSLWIDQLDIRPSQHWDSAIEAAVRGCDGLIVMLSPRSVGSSNVADEVAVAIDSGKRVIPILIERCLVPLRMTRMQLIDATVDYDRALRRCIAETGRPPVDSAGGTTVATPLAATLSPETAADAERKLTAIVGPIAHLLVRTAMAKAQSEEELYQLLAAHIADAADRARFLRRGRSQADTLPAAAPASVSAGDIDDIGRALTRFLGPIAPLVTEREAASACSPEHLCRRLSRLVPVEEDRAAFLKMMKVTPG